MLSQYWPPLGLGRAIVSLFQQATHYLLDLSTRPQRTRLLVHLLVNYAAHGVQVCMAEQELQIEAVVRWLGVGTQPVRLTSSNLAPPMYNTAVCAAWR